MRKLRGRVPVRHRIFRALVSILALIASLFTQVLTTSTTASASTPVVQSIGVGGETSCAVMSDGNAYCWGDNTYGQFGNGTNTSSATPQLVSGSYTWTQISTQIDGTDTDPTTCGVTTSGAGYCWGSNLNGNVGDGTSTPRTTPTPISGGLTWASISVGWFHVCGVTTAGAGYCWGNNGQGQLGDGTGTSKDTPTAISGGYTWRSISSGSERSCGVTTGNVAYCWGDNFYGELGTGGSSSSTPALVAGGHSWSSINTGFEDTCGVTTSNLGYCWGRNGNGEDGNNTTTEQDTPALVSGGDAWSTITTGTGTSCGVTALGAGYCWGVGWVGQTGDGTGNNSSVPSAVSDGHVFANIIAGGNYNAETVCGVAADGILYCWGANNHSQIGDGTTNDGYVPIESALLFASVNNTNLSVTITPTFTFTVANQSSACNGESNFVFGAGTPSAVALGNLAAGANVSGGQALTVAGNSGGGFAVYVAGTQATNNLRSGSHNWTDVSGTYVSPAPLGGGEQFGYTYNDSTASSSVTNPASANFVALTNTNEAVMGSTSSESGNGCISYDAQTSASTPAASYTATVVYTAVPTF